MSGARPPARAAPPRLRLARGAPVAIELVRAVDGGPPALATRATLLDDGERLAVDFDCDDPEPWATQRARDAPLWEEEVVELFLAPGAAPPERYFEFELNPLGALFDGAVRSPRGDRRGMTVDAGWNCAGIEWSAARRAGGWRARLAVPWRALAGAQPPRLWRANLYRVDRPPRAPAEFSAWSPTLALPADFHRPRRFGFLRRVG